MRTTKPSVCMRTTKPSVYHTGCPRRKFPWSVCSRVQAQQQLSKRSVHHVHDHTSLAVTEGSKMRSHMHITGCWSIRHTLRARKYISTNMHAT
jgi:hypothetical protein